MIPGYRLRKSGTSGASNRRSDPSGAETITTANVFFIIIPNQKIVVADLTAGRTPDAKYGKIAKLRRTHNNYQTLPVVFLMGVTIRHWFNTRHARAGSPWWIWGATVLLFHVPFARTHMGRDRASAEGCFLRYGGGCRAPRTGPCFSGRDCRRHAARDTGAPPCPRSCIYSRPR